MTGSPAASAEAPAGPAADALDAELIRLHGSGAASRLSVLHEQAAALFADPGARRFHLTHAWVYALEAGADDAVARLEAALRAAGGLRPLPADARNDAAR